MSFLKSSTLIELRAMLVNVNSLLMKQKKREKITVKMIVTARKIQFMLRTGGEINMTLSPLTKSIGTFLLLE